MTSRRLFSSSPFPFAAHRYRALLIAIAASVSSLPVLALFLYLFYLYLSQLRSPTLPFSSPSPSPSPSGSNPLPLRRFSYRSLLSCTAYFDPARALGRGASATVFRGVLPDGKSVAVKRLLSSPSSPTRAAAASDREFHNELQVLAALGPSPYVVSVLGYCIEGRRRRLLVYEYMPNGSLQEALFGPGSPLDWDRRRSIIIDVAQALAFLHLECNPPVVHGDIKPSNVLLGFDYNAKISDFGMSRLKTEVDLGPEFFSQDLGLSQAHFSSQELAHESQQVESFSALHASSPAAFSNYLPRMNPRGKEAAVAPSSTQDEICSFEHSKELSVNMPTDDECYGLNYQLGKRWWWKQDESRELSSNEYVTEWIGSQISPADNMDCVDRRIPSEKCFDLRNSGPVGNLDAVGDALFSGAHEKNPEMKQGEMKQGRKKGGLHCDSNKDRKMREWWKEEYFAEISRKGHSKKEKRWFPTICSRGVEYTNTALPIDDDGKHSRDLNMELSFRKDGKRKSQSVSSKMFSSELLSKELSSTTSMRGTVCYVAPECHGCDQLMEKADIYSFGVLLLVIVSGRRPLHVLPSPVKLEKANLVTWCRQLAQTGNILEIVDERLKGSYNKDQASLCINLALLCLQRNPETRPDSGDIIKILRGELELPAMPYEFSPSPPVRHYNMSRREASTDVE